MIRKIGLLAHLENCFSLFGWAVLVGALSACHAGSDSKALSTPKLDSTLEIEDEAAIIKKLKEKTPRDAAIEKGVKYLIQNQGKDGSISKGKYKTAFTSLAMMALMAAGHTPDSKPYGDAMKRGIHYVLSQMRNDGYLGARDGSRMYGHGISTLMLVEAAGMTRDKELERRLVDQGQRSVNLILKAQAVKKGATQQGGWRYQPHSRDSDLSLTGWQTMALRAAKNSGYAVSDAAIQQAVGYIRRMAHKKGGFGYTAPMDKPNLRGVGLLALPVCGVYDTPELKKTTALLLKDPPKWKGDFFYYRIYYSTLGMYQMGDDAWKKFFPIIDELLIKRQKPDGSWPNPPSNRESWETYRTSIAILCLAVHYQLLPIYQR